MNQFILYIIIGLFLGIVIFPIGLGIYLLIKNTLERRKVKRLLNEGKFLTPIDPKDFDSKSWQNQEFGNINVEKGKQELENLENKIFKSKDKENMDNIKEVPIEEEIKKNE